MRWFEWPSSEKHSGSAGAWLAAFRLLEREVSEELRAVSLLESGALPQALKELRAVSLLVSGVSVQAWLVSALVRLPG